MLAAALGACGSSGSQGSSQDESSKSAAQIYADALNAMTEQRTVHITGHQVDTTGASADLDVVDALDSARITLRTSSGGTFYLVVTPDVVYGSQSLAGPYQQAPPDLATQVRSLTINFTVRCARIEHGTLTKGATSTVAGQRVIAIDDNGRAPGASASTVYVALTGPPLLVRVEQHGATTKGGTADCGHPPSDTSPPTKSAVFDFTGWGTPVTITPPPSGAA